MKNYSVTFIALAVTMMATAAQAQLASVEKPLPETGTLDRTGDKSAVSVSNGTTLLRSQLDGVSNRTDLHVRYVHHNDFGVYGHLPLNAIWSDAAGTSTSEFGLGNLELGGLYALRHAPGHKLLLRAGVLLPTASKDLAGAMGSFAGNASRFTDFATSAPTTWTRLSVSPVGRIGAFIYRADLGVDVPFGDYEVSAGAAMATVDPDVLGRLNLGAGYDFGPMSLMAEFATIANLENFESDNIQHTAAITANLTMWPVQPYASIVMPLKKDARDQVVGSAMVGVSVPFPM